MLVKKIPEGRKGTWDVIILTALVVESVSFINLVEPFVRDSKLDVEMTLSDVEFSLPPFTSIYKKYAGRLGGLTPV